MNNAVFVIFSPNLLGLEFKQTKIIFNKPIYVGMCVLDLAELQMYSFHYDYMKKQGFKTCNLLYTDTDSLIYEIDCEDIYTDLIKRDCRTVFDTYGYKIDNPFSIPRVNNRVISLIKDELNGMILHKFIGIGSKMYALLIYNEDGSPEEKKVAKGVSRSVIKNRISFNAYYLCLFEDKSLICEQRLIRNRLHNVYTVKEHKVALRRGDDKRWTDSNQIDTLPWGYRNIPPHLTIQQSRIL
ncbi:hypothetical protein QAD02_020605 [Eretmocerus hayati]|uniref:Uncharacterized protein n=1 Tax=Eretmocerus hayati TaxID=131215 RepID=A0ACC2PN37_9HYME|nr:hypothetical protein QAD02_020605 [Eretmocerus hayati]